MTLAQVDFGDFETKHSQFYFCFRFGLSDCSVYTKLMVQAYNLLSMIISN